VSPSIFEASNEAETDALRHLENCESAYAAIGPAGAFVRRMTLEPLRARWNAGERSPELLREILEVKL